MSSAESSAAGCGPGGYLACPSLPQLEVLIFVSENGEPLMRDIARYLNVKAPSATELVAELVRTRHLTRLPGTRDRREVRVALTAKGRAALAKSNAKRMRVFSEVLSPLSEPERREMEEVLRKVVERTKL